MGQTLLQRLGSLIYIVNPKTSSFEHASEVPNYVAEAIPLFLAFMTLESLIKIFQGKEVRVNENLSSIGIGILHEATVFASGTFMFLGYQWLYQYRLFTLPWDSLYTWFAAIFFIDFCYYWVHRCNHEINILWAVHQVHHSSEDYNLTTALRLSMFQRAAYIGFFHPLAIIGFPFSTVIVHAAFNYLFQFWLHSDLIYSLGPLEYVFTSPSLHKVHHGANKWCLDKNYGSMFILWDRIFGTFEPARESEEITYGLTEQPQTHNAIYMEFFYFWEIYKKAKSMDNWPDTLKSFFYGPGWSPGMPRLGDPDTFPDIKSPRQKYDPHLQLWMCVYLTLHMAVIALGQQILLHRMSTSSWGTIIMSLFCIFVTLGVIGGLTDNRWWAPLIEVVRCGAFVTYAYNTPFTNVPMLDSIIVTYFAISMMIWTVKSMHGMSKVIKTSKKVAKLE